MELKDQAEIQRYVDSLEREIMSIKKSHSYRIGKAVVDYYKGPKLVGIRSFFKNLASATKKVELKQNKKIIRLPERIVYQNKADFRKESSYFENKTPDALLNQPFISYQRKIKNTPIVLALDSQTSSPNEDYFYVHPNELDEYFIFLNADKIVLNLGAIYNDPLWRGFGTYDEAELTLKFMDYLEKSSIPINKRYLLRADLIGNYPLLLQFVHLFAK
ncbi:hypothetical protein CEQ07_09250 [Oligella urethralis]|uniref:hypothetical protein n=1 Tax=Oligella urethralis TaxID=90245 RepID=UPI000CFF480B|nr:hypothetical protein [Oligella urethralis]AVL71587.1 hypothetical protein CEQ07_09250 [Oligella urethralis]